MKAFISKLFFRTKKFRFLELLNGSGLRRRILLKTMRRRPDFRIKQNVPQARLIKQNAPQARILDKILMSSLSC